MRAPALLLPLLVLVAGCTGAPPTTGTPATPAPGRVLFVPDCAIVVPVGTWPEACVAKASPNPSPSKTEIDVAANPKDPFNVIAGSKDLDKGASDCVWAVPQVSHDGGKTWKTVYIGGKKADRKPGDPLFPWACITDPILVFNKAGVAFYTLQAYDAQQQTPLPFGDTGSAMYLARSKDGGDTWDKIVTLHAGEGTAIYHDYIRMAANPKTGSVYAIWNQISSAGPVPAGASVPVLVATRDGGETAAAPVYITTPDAATDLGESAIAAAQDGTVFVMMGGPNSNGAAYVSLSKDDGQTFSTPAKVFTTTAVKSPLPNSTFRVGTSVEMAVDRNASASCLQAVWADGAKGDGDADILARRSCDQGKTWTDPVRVNHDTTKSDQFMPRVAVGDDGTVHVVYLTRAYDPDHTLLDAEYAYSLDGGATWATKRLTSVSWNGDLGVHQNGFPFLGDYIGIDSQGARTYAGFPDCATGVCEIGVAALVRA